ncbi:unnamed protein product [Phaedon cochleariae]|uniref:Serpin domain-containing protein n=1 Tax=Phaedon cochleariae TaxID=80249 RepID=A0A9P0DAX0_PHACE|nr:unnamed protein product [Phaedon cochleariae]
MFVSFALVVCLGLIVHAGDLTTPGFPFDDVYYPNANWSDTFDWKLLKEYSTQYRNILISPASLKILLALLYQGSSGITQREFESLLQFTDQKTVREQYRTVLSQLQIIENHEYVFNMGTRIFLDPSVQPQQRFASIAKDFFKTDIEITNFHESLEASESINSWAEKLTNGRISTLVTPADVQYSVMVLANAMYFRGSWRYQFPKENSRNGKFFIPHGDEFVTVQTPYMSTVDKFYYTESSTLDAKILRLPYKGGRYSMFIVLPNSRGGLPNLMKSININSLKDAMFTLDLQSVDVRLPKFKFDFQAKLGQTLRNFGLMQMFQNTASFPGIARDNTTRQLVVSDIIQKSGIAIDEEGSVAYAASEVSLDNRFAQYARPLFDASHPFMFHIEDERTGTILFVGKIENPLEK